MTMFCQQCQEAAGNKGCTVKGVCGKTAETANLQDVLLHVLKGIAYYAEPAFEDRAVNPELGRFLSNALFATLTNTNFDDDRMIAMIREGFKHRETIKSGSSGTTAADPPDAAVWYSADPIEYQAKAAEVGFLSIEDPDIRSLRSLIVFGLKGVAAYAHHAQILGYEDPGIYAFLIKALSATLKDLPAEELTALVLETGKTAVDTMALLDKANTETYGHPELTEVELGVRENPAILISGHDLKDLDELLKQTEGTGIDVYTHGEMLPAHSYPAFKKYDHFVGNYGGSWWRQASEFEAFNGPILMTTNCIVPPRDSYKQKIFTSGTAGYPGVRHIPGRKPGGVKDFSALIELAKTCPPPTELEKGSLTAGFAHNQVMGLADKVIEAVQTGAVKRFVVMAGCDGRHKSRQYFSDVAEALPEDAVILTAGCAKYRYNKLGLGDIGGIPRVLDAGQCNDSYSLAVIALKLKEVFGLEDINQLPLSMDIAWYEQKAVAVLLALLYLGFKGIRLGPTLPAFLSPNVAKVLVENFDIKPIGDVKADVEAMMAGR